MMKESRAMGMKMKIMMRRMRGGCHRSVLGGLYAALAVGGGTCVGEVYAVWLPGVSSRILDTAGVDTRLTPGPTAAWAL
jgi:hypothetical protein